MHSGETRIWVQRFERNLERVKPMIDSWNFQANRNTAEHTADPPHQTDEPRRHFLVPWRLNANTAHALWHQGDDAGCGQVPVD
jgi:hypothetical protein